MTINPSGQLSLNYIVNTWNTDDGSFPTAATYNLNFFRGVVYYYPPNIVSHNFPTTNLDFSMFYSTSPTVSGTPGGGK